jgi:hypothetical protein
VPAAKASRPPPSPEGQKAPTQRTACAPHPDSLPASREVHHRILHARQGRRTSATCGSDQQPQHEDKASRRQTPALTTTAVGAAQRPAAPRTSRNSRRTTTRSSRRKTGSGGPSLLHRQPDNADEEASGRTRQPCPPQSAGEEKREPRRRLPREPHEQPAARSGSGAARGGEVRVAAARVRCPLGRPRRGDASGLRNFQ